MSHILDGRQECLAHRGEKRYRLLQRAVLVHGVKLLAGRRLRRTPLATIMGGVAEAEIPGEVEQCGSARNAAAKWPTLSGRAVSAAPRATALHRFDGLPELTVLGAIGKSPFRPKPRRRPSACPGGSVSAR